MSETPKTNLQSFIKVEERQPAVQSAPQFLLGQQGIDFNSALNLLLASQAAGKQMIPVLSQPAGCNQVTNFPNTENSRTGLESGLTQASGTPTSLSKILNVLNKEHEIGQGSSSCWMKN